MGQDMVDMFRSPVPTPLGELLHEPASKAMHNLYPSSIWCQHAVKYHLVAVMCSKNSISALPGKIVFWYILKTRMHSSRMHTTRLLTISRSIRWGWGVVCPTPLDADHPSPMQTPSPRCRPPRTPWTEWHTHVKILPCPKLRLRTVMKE